MSEDMRATVLTALKRDEGLKLTPYRCTAGKLTIGYGRNLEDVGITRDEAESMLASDVDQCIAACRAWPWFDGLSPVRQAVIVNMAYNLGMLRLRMFKQMLAAVARGDYRTAADEMLRSRWATQVGDRATRLAAQMRTGLKWGEGA